MDKNAAITLAAMALLWSSTTATAQAGVDTTTTAGPDTLTTIAPEVPDATFDDGFYRLNAHEKAKPYDLPKVDRNNVIFFKRIWRDIDLNDTANYIFVTPGNTLMEALTEGIRKGEIIAFDPVPSDKNPTGDAFTAPLPPGAAFGKLTDSVLVPIFDEMGNEIGSEMKMNDFDPAKVTKFRVKEDIFLDKQRSRIETRIIGLAPLISLNIGDEQLSEQPAFWIYFPQARKVLATKEIVDPKKGIVKQSMDDIFIQHRFSSTIIKESNPGELSINDYSEDKERESKRIEREIYEYKKNFWKYK